MNNHNEAPVTPWFTGTQTPVQIGVYQRQNLAGDVRYSFWDGDHWRWAQRTPHLAASEDAASISLRQQAPWRGLLFPPPQGYGPAEPITTNPARANQC